MRVPRLRIVARGMMLASGLLPFLWSVSISSQARAQGLDELKDMAFKSGHDSTGRPMSALAARTWIALHETMIRPLPDHTPLRKILQALGEATRGKAGLAEGITFHVEPTALLVAETTMDRPATNPFVGRPEVSVDTYLKYLLHEFAWERYVGDGVVLIDSPCDDCEGYATVGLPAARTRLMLHEVVPLDFPRGAPLGDVLGAIATTTAGRAKDGRGLVISIHPLALRERNGILDSPVRIDTRDAEVVDSLRSVLRQVGLAHIVLADGTVLVVRGSEGRHLNFWLGSFPEYRYTYEFLWNQWVKEIREAADLRIEQRRRPPANP